MTGDPGLTVKNVFFEPREVLFNEGDPPTGMFFIEEGTVEVYRTSGARSITMARLGRGDVVGELALIENIPHTQSVRATTPVSAMLIEPAQVTRALENSPSLVRMILKRVVRKLHRTNDLAFGSSKRVE